MGHSVSVHDGVSSVTFDPEGNNKKTNEGSRLDGGVFTRLPSWSAQSPIWL